ncbi:MAG: AAA family ATPase [bacterium]|nr:AAA family ATPase [bacterium]
MRLHRVRLRHFRGIEEFIVEFPTTGVTVIEGPNEVGKSCIPQAIDLIMEKRASSRAKAVRSVKPVHRDEAPEVEIEATTGEYRFVYWKRWLRRPQTILQITSPRSESLTGREAHERVREILADSLDMELWGALRIEQGAGTLQPTLTAHSLGRALDFAAGAEVSQDREEHLWNRVQTERERYWSATGRVKSDRKSLERKVEEAEAQLEYLDKQLRELEDEAEEADRLSRDEHRLNAQVEATRRRLADLEKRWESTQEVRNQVQQLEEDYVAAMERRDLARAGLRNRQALVQELANLTNHVAALEEEAEQTVPALSAAVDRHEWATAALDEARCVLQTVRERQLLSYRDLDHHNRRIEAEQLTERYERIMNVQSDLNTIEDELESNKIDEDLVERIAEALSTVALAEGTIKGVAASLEITAEDDLTLQIGENRRQLLNGQVEHLVVLDQLQLTVPGVLLLDVRAGRGSRDSTAELARARQELKSLYAVAGVADLAEAQRALRRRQDLEHQHSRAREALQQNLGNGVTADVLRRRIKGLQRQVGSYGSERNSDESLPLDREAAEQIAEELESQVADLQERYRLRESAAEACCEQRRLAESAHADLRGQIERAIGSREHATDSLEKAREEKSDAILEAALESAQGKVDKASRLLELAKRDLRAADPDSVWELLDNERGVQDRIVEQLRSNQQEQERLQIMLEVRGEEGLHGQRQEAEGNLQHLDRQFQSTERRAQTARLLYDVFSARRLESRRRYRAPLRQRIEDLGRIVFDETFEVELDDDLSISRRTLQGVPLDVDQLSIGACEQMALLSRLACAMIVSPEGGGAPVIIDDALGWSDPVHLRRMGAAIAVAGRECQIIVLTCTPGRYEHVGNARVIEFYA